MYMVVDLCGLGNNTLELFSENECVSNDQFFYLVLLSVSFFLISFQMMKTMRIVINSIITS